jgi:hypothetical protein
MPIVPIAPTERIDPKLPPARVRVRTRPAPDAIPLDAAATAAVTQETSSDYKVGYRQPPKHTQFKPGQSGNSKGRPKAAKGLQSIVRETLTQKVAVRTATGTKRISRIEAVLQKTLEQAMKGNPRALAELIKLYSNAVPEEKPVLAQDEPGEDLTATDLATLEELRQILSGDEG